MSWKRWVALSGLFLAFATFGSFAIAGETPETEPKPADEENKPVQEAVAPPEAPKPRWWGDRFALYIESNTGGAATARDIDTSIDFGDRLNSKVLSSSAVGFNKMDTGRLAIGWQLPAQRGMFLVVWNGVRERDYRFNATGAQRFARTRVDQEILDNYTRDVGPSALTWWRVRVLGGQLTAQRSIPICELQDGGCSAITYEYDNPDLNTTIETSIAPDLQNRAQTLDFLYQREFGGRMFSGRWTCGPRYFLYRGTVPAATWVNDADFPGIGYTDGKYIHLLPVSQNTKGYGVTGSLEAQYHFLRNRVVLYAQGRVAYIYQTLRADTGEFYTLVRDTTSDAMYPSPARLEQNRNKTSWQVGAEAGVRIRLVEGLQFEAGAGQTSYQDSVLIPTTILIPKTYQESVQGTSALYTTRDLLYDGWHAGFSYQF